jgi:ribosomal protein L11 methyltransferase
MAWLECTIKTTAADIESVAAKLTAGGFADLVIEDQNEFEDFLEQNREYWDYIDDELQQKLEGLSQIKIYLEDTDTKGQHTLDALVCSLGLNMSVSTLPDVDYAESWKDSYPPQPVGKKLMVLPYWLSEQDAGDRQKVILDPGLTFGTGAHPSTQMVMEAMEELVRPGDHCLDLGSGSGILSITALRLGACSAIGVNIDPKAEDIARENAAYNGYSAPEFEALTGNVTADHRLMEHLAQKDYRVVLVNIVADVIIGLAPTLPDFLSEETSLICSGILDSRLQEVCSALEACGISVTAVKAKDEWRCVIGRRRSA